MTIHPDAGVEYRIQQESNSRYLDAHFGVNDNSAVTRSFQPDDTQVWTFEWKGSLSTFQQAHNGRFLDAWPVNQDTFGNIVNYRVVTRPAQHNPSQEWYVLTGENAVQDGPVQGGPPTILHRVRQLSTKRYLDAYESEAKDHLAVTRGTQAGTNQEDTQLWEMGFVGNTGDNTYTFRQRSSGRFLDAYTQEPYDAVTREYQLQIPSQTLTQRWIQTHVGGLYAIKRKENGVYLDAHTSGGHNAVVRSFQDNDTQIWILRDAGNGRVTIQQLNTLRYLDAYQSQPNDWSAVTRGPQGDDSQRWRITAT